jgi:hypothetical protein
MLLQASLAEVVAVIPHRLLENRCELAQASLAEVVAVIPQASLAAEVAP